MQSRVLVLYALCSATLQAQSISVISPTSGATLSGWTGNQFAVSLSSAPSAVQVCYTLDAYPAVNPGPPGVVSGNSGALLVAGCSNAAPYSFPVDTYWWANGTQHQVVATAYSAVGQSACSGTWDGNGCIVATSSPVIFTIANTWPVSCPGSAPSLAITASTPFTSNWSGQVNVTATVTGPCASDNISAMFSIDGIQQGGGTSFTSGSTLWPLDTTGFPNGTHVVGVATSDNNAAHYTNYAGYGSNVAGEFTANVIFSNGTVPAYTVTNARRIYIAPAATFTLTPSLINTDRSVASGTLFDFLSINPSAVTVSYTGTAATSTTVTGVAQGASQIYSMAEAKTGSDGTTALSNLNIFHSNSLGTYPNYLFGLIKIVGGINCIPGLYLIGAANSNGDFTLQSPAHPGTNVPFATALGATCSWAIGPARVSYAQVNSTNAAIAHFSNQGGILTSYTPGKSIVLNEIFESFQEISSQPYPVPYLNSICQSGYNTLETGGSAVDTTSWTGSGYSNPTTTAATFATYVASQTSLLTAAPCQLYIWLTGDFMMRNGGDLYATTQGPTSARNGSTFSTSALALLFQSYKTSNLAGNAPIIGMTMEDEFAYLGTTMQGPITLGGTSNNQNWLGSSSSITTSGSPTVCQVSPTTGVPGGSWGILEGAASGGGFVITGSVTTGMNTTIGGTRYIVLSGSSPTSFSFNCPNVASGLTLNSTNDPGLRINVNSCCAWYTPPGGSSATDFLRDDAMAYLAAQMDTVSGRIPTAPSIAGNISGTATWYASCVLGGPGTSCGQFLTEGGVNEYVPGGSGTFADIYSTHGALEPYLSARQALNAAVSDSPTGALEQTQKLSLMYGGYDPALPMETIGQGTSINFTWNATTPSLLPVTSCIGNTITFSAPHLITNLIPGASRLWITGSTDPSCNNNFVILSAPTPTTVTAALAATTQVCTDTGTTSCAYHNLANATLTFQNGDTYSGTSAQPNQVYEISADGLTTQMGGGATIVDYGTTAITGAQSGCSAPVSGGTGFLRHRGQTFTISGATGPAAAYFNSTTFVYDIENLSQPTDGNGTPSACDNYFREIPVLSGTGGTANIVYDGSYVQGRNGSDVGTAGNSDPDWTFINIVDAMILRAAGTRLYKMMENPVAYVSQYTSPSKGGWTGSGSGANVAQYTQTTLNYQLFSHPHAESGYSVPDFWAGSTANLMWSRLAKYHLGATALNSVDYGPMMESGTFQSGYGYLHIVLNASNGSETRTVTLTPWETSGQNVILWIADAIHGIQPITIINAGTPNYNLTLQPGQAAYFLFPVTFAGELTEPTAGFKLSDVANATSVSAQCAYDQYLLPLATPTSLGSGSGGFVTATLPYDKAVGSIYCTVSYLGSANQPLAGGPTSAVLTF